MNKSIQSQLDKVFQHIETYNREMGGVLSEIKNIKNEICDIKKIMSENAKKLEVALQEASKSTPAWVTYVIGVLMAIIGWVVAGAFK